MLRRSRCVLIFLLSTYVLRVIYRDDANRDGIGKERETTILAYRAFWRPCVVINLNRGQYSNAMKRLYF